MGVSSIGVCVLKEEKNIPELFDSILTACKSLAQDGVLDRVDKVKEDTPEMYASICFKLKETNEQRVLWVHFEDGGYEGSKDSLIYGKKNKFAWSLNVWGEYEKVMKTIALAVIEKGDCFWDRNDSDDEDFVRFDKKLNMIKRIQSL